MAGKDKMQEHEEASDEGSFDKVPDISVKDTSEIGEKEFVDEKMEEKEFVGKKMEEEIVGKKMEEKEFVEKKMGEKEFVGKKMGGKEFIGKKMGEKEFVGKKMEEKEFVEKKMEEKEFVDKRIEEKEFVDKKIEEKEFVDKKIEEKEFVDKKIEEFKIRIKSNERTVEALKRNLEAIEKCFSGTDKSTKKLENSLITIEKIIRSEQDNGNTGNETDEECDLTTEEILADFMKEVVKTKESFIGMQTSRSAASANGNSAKISESNKTSVKHKTVRKKVKTPRNAEKIKDEEKRFSETWNSILSGDSPSHKGNAGTKLKSAEKINELIKTNFEKNNIDWPPTVEFPRLSENVIEDAYTNIGMDNPLNALLFSEQLIEYVLNKVGYIWPCTGGVRNFPRSFISTRFSKVIGEAVLVIINRNIVWIADSYKRLIEKNIRTTRAFSVEVCITATFYFNHGYRHDKFLIYAAQLAGLSVFYFACGDTHIADASAQVLAYILNFYTYQLLFSPFYDWFTLHLKAQKLRRDIENGKIIFVLPSGTSE